MWRKNKAELIWYVWTTRKLTRKYLWQYVSSCDASVEFQTRNLTENLLVNFNALIPVFLRSELTFKLWTQNPSITERTLNRTGNTCFYQIKNSSYLIILKTVGPPKFFIFSRLLSIVNSSAYFAMLQVMQRLQ